MIDLFPPVIFVGIAIPLLALHTYLVFPRKKKTIFWRASVVTSISAIGAATLWIWSIEHDRSPENANGLAAGFSTLFSIAGILGLQLALLIVDFVNSAPKTRPYFEEGMIQPNQSPEPTSTAVTPPASASDVLRRDKSASEVLRHDKNAGDRASGTRGLP